MCCTIFIDLLAICCGAAFAAVGDGLQKDYFFSDVTWIQG